MPVLRGARVQRPTARSQHPTEQTLPGGLLKGGRSPCAARFTQLQGVIGKQVDGSGVLCPKASSAGAALLLGITARNARCPSQEDGAPSVRCSGNSSVLDLIEASKDGGARLMLLVAGTFRRRSVSLAVPIPRRNNSLIRGANIPVPGVRAWGDIIMTDSENWKERRNQVARYRAMEQETTDPLAARLLHDIVLELEAELEGSSNDPSSS